MPVIQYHSCEGAVLYSELLITNWTFDNNRDGAVAIFQNKVIIVINTSYFSGNIAHKGAAAIQANYGSKTTITNTQFCYNEVDFDYCKLKVFTISTPGGAVIITVAHACEVEICRK